MTSCKIGYLESSWLVTEGLMKFITVLQSVL